MKRFRLYIADNLGIFQRVIVIDSMNKIEALSEANKQIEWNEFVLNVEEE